MPVNPFEDILKPEERVTLSLRRLYERRGYAKYRMSRFEEYELYLENKNFLGAKSIITFNDADGRLLALKPDVTLSIAKNTHATRASGEKFYYLENVYRQDLRSRAYREIRQLGLEYIGDLTDYAAGEVLTLAMRTLREISPSAKLQLSHAGFIQSLLDSLTVDESVRRELTDLIRRKNLDDLGERALCAGVSPAAVSLLTSACALSGPLVQALERAKDVAITPGMTEALSKLEKMGAALDAAGCLDGVTVDFSLMNDLDYYSDLVLRGYVEGLPRAVLAGGCYASLMKKFGRNVDAMGFAVYLNELTFLYEGPRPRDVDLLLIYGAQDDLAQVTRRVDELIESGFSVRAEKSRPQGLRYGREITMAEAVSC
jgi:ATP phosphoribosyltransferase regulatory subunit